MKKQTFIHLVNFNFFFLKIYNIKFLITKVNKYVNIDIIICK